MVVLKKLRHRARVILPALTLLSGCWLPYADLDQSLSLLTAEKMGAPVWSFTLEVDYDRQAAIYFLPENDPQPQRGYLISYDTVSLDPVFYVGTEMGVTRALKDDFMWSAPRPSFPRPVMFPNNSVKNTIIYLTSPIDLKYKHDIRASYRNPPLSGNFLTFSSNLIQNNSIQLVASGVHYLGDITPKASALLLTSNSQVLTVNDANVLPSDGSFFNPYDNDYNMTPYFYNLNPPLSSELTATSRGTIFRFETDGFTDFDGVICFHLGNGKYKTLRYLDNNKVREYSFEGVVESVLNNATLLLVRNGAMYEVYKGDETLVSRFPAGSIIFCHEVFMNGRWWSVFSRTLVRSPFQDENSRQKEIKVDVWYIRSDRLDTLNS